MLHDIVIEAVMQGPLRVAICEFVGLHLGKGEIRRIPCRRGAIGSIIKIRQNATTPQQLVLCEVEVYGYPGKITLHGNSCENVNFTADFAVDFLDTLRGKEIL